MEKALDGPGGLSHKTPRAAGFILAVLANKRPPGQARRLAMGATTMKRKLIAGTVLLMCCGCSSMNNTEAGALGGGLIGGALGTIVGAACHNPLAGAAIGAAGGAGVGA